MRTFSFLILFFFPVLLWAQTDRLITFEMEDQFRAIHTHQEYSGKITVLIGSDGGGSKYNKKWAKAIDDTLLADSIEYHIGWLPVADVSAAPFFMKGIVRSQFPEKKELWALCDWDGIFAETYNFQEDKSNIIVFDANGKLIYQCAGTDVDRKKVKELVEIIRKNYRING